MPVTMTIRTVTVPWSSTRRSRYRAALLLLAFALLFAVEPVQAQHESSHSPPASKAFPVLVFEVNGVSAVDAGAFLYSVSGRSGAGTRWASKTSRSLLMHPFALAPEVARGRGFAYFWNPAGSTFPAMAEYVCVLPSEQIDPELPPVHSQHSQSEGRFKVTVHSPGRFTHSYYTGDLESTFDSNGRLATTRALSPTPLFSYYFADAPGVLWQSNDPGLLTAELPDVQHDPSENPAVRLWFDPTVIPADVRAAWLKAAAAGLALSNQRRDDESATSWRSRVLSAQLAQIAFTTLLADDTTISGNFEANEFGYTDGRLVLQCPSLDRFADLSTVAPTQDVLSSVQGEDPWFTFWIGLRPPSAIRDSVSDAVTLIERDLPSSDRGWWQLLRSVAESAEFQCTVAGITDTEGASGIVVGVSGQSIERLQEVLTSALTAAIPILDSIVSSSDIAFSCEENSFWAVIGTASPQATLSRIQSRSHITKVSTRQPRQLARLEIDFSRIRASSTLRPVRNSTPSPARKTERMNFIPLSSIVDAVSRLHQDSIAKAELKDPEQNSYWKLRAVVSTVDDSIQLRVQSGYGASLALTSAGLVQIEALRAAARQR